MFYSDESPLNHSLNCTFPIWWHITPASLDSLGAWRVSQFSVLALHYTSKMSQPFVKAKIKDELKWEM